MTPPVLRVRHGEVAALSVKSWAEYRSIFSINSSWVAFGALLRAYLNGGTNIHESPIEEVKNIYPRLTDEALGKTFLGEKRLLEGKMGGGTEQMKRVLAGVEDLARNYKNKTVKGRLFSEQMSDDHDSTTQYFTKIKDKIPLHDLVKAHFSKAPLARSQAQRTKENRIFVSDHSVPAYSMMEMYFSYIPDYITFVKGKFWSRSPVEVKGSLDEDLIVEAWLTLMWRGYLFNFLHQFKTDFGGIYAPHEYYGSRLPVFMV